jgi:hypothetical protein
MTNFPNQNAAATGATTGYGATFSVTEGETSTQIAEVTEIKPSGLTVGEEDVTNLGSPNAHREYIPTLVESGTVEFSGNYIGDTTQQGLETLARARTVFPFSFAFLLKSGKVETRTGTGFITKYNPGDVVKDKVISFSCTLRITGVETVAQV